MSDFEDKERQWQRAEPTWTGTRGNGNYLTRGEFYARWDPLQPKLDFLYDKLTDLENRMPQELAKDIARDAIASLWGKLFIIVAAVVTAYVVSQVGFDIHHIGLGGLIP